MTADHQDFRLCLDSITHRPQRNVLSISISRLFFANCPDTVLFRDVECAINVVFKNEKCAMIQRNDVMSDDENIYHDF